MTEATAKTHIQTDTHVHTVKPKHRGTVWYPEKKNGQLVAEF